MISGFPGRPRGPQDSLSEAQEGSRWLEDGRGPQEGPTMAEEGPIGLFPLNCKTYMFSKTASFVFAVPQAPPKSPKTA
eukprot:5970920-Pyramimonas_sp.AAC.1